MWAQLPAHTEICPCAGVVENILGRVLDACQTRMNALLAGSLVDSLVKSPAIAALMALEPAALLAGEPAAFFAGKVPLPCLAWLCQRLLHIVLCCLFSEAALLSTYAAWSSW